MAALFDLHCDTLTRNLYPPYEKETETLDNPAFQLALGKVPAGTRWVQCFAVFVPDGERGEDAVRFFDRAADSFHHQAAVHRDRMADCRSLADGGGAGRRKMRGTAYRGGRRGAGRPPGAGEDPL